MEAHAEAHLPFSPRETSGWRHFVYVTRALTVTEFKMRYFGSVLGYLWTLLRPLMLFGVLYLVFTQIVRSTPVPHYPVALLSGIVLFNYFAEATVGGLTSLVARENLLRKVSFPRLAVPVAVSLTAAVNLALGLVVVFVFALLNGIAPSLTWILFLLNAVCWVVLATSLSVLLSVLYVRFRDAQPAWEVAMQALFYATPIIYPIEAVLEKSEKFAHLMMLNPLAVLVTQARHWLIGPQLETASSAIGGGVRLLIPLGIALALIGLSALAYTRNIDSVAEDL